MQALPRYMVCGNTKISGRQILSKGLYKIGFTCTLVREYLVIGKGNLFPWTMKREGSKAMISFVNPHQNQH